MIVFIQNGQYHTSEMSVEEFYESNLFKTKGCTLYEGIWPIPEPPPTPPTRSDIEAQRKARYSQEADCLRNEADYDAIKAGTSPDYSVWIAKVDQIKAELPYP